MFDARPVCNFPEKIGLEQRLVFLGSEVDSL